MTEIQKTDSVAAETNPYRQVAQLAIRVKADVSKPFSEAREIWKGQFLKAGEVLNNAELKKL